MARPHLTPTSPTKRFDISNMPREMKLELLIGHLFDVLAPTRELVEALRLRDNASATTRAQLDTLIDLTNAVYSVLRDIRARVERDKAEHDDGRSDETK
jgi:hypothetical protein